MDFSPWLVFALLTPFFWAFNNVLDRAVISHLVKNEYALTFMAGMTRLPFAVILFALTDWYVPETKLLLLGLFTGFLNMIPIIFYLRALEKADTPAVILAYDAANPIFVLLLSSVFLSEKLTPVDGLGFLFLLLAGMLSSLKIGAGLKVTRHVWWIVLAAFLWAPPDILFDHLVGQYQSVLSVLAWSFIGGFFGSFFLLSVPKIRRRCRFSDFRWPKLGWFLFILSTPIAFLGYFTFLKAFELGQVSLTVVMTNVQPLFVFILEIVLAVLFVKSKLFNRPDIGWRTLVPKAFALLCTIAGVWFLGGG